MAAFGRRPGGLNSGGLKNELPTPATDTQVWRLEGTRSHHSGQTDGQGTDPTQGGGGKCPGFPDPEAKPSGEGP